MQKARPCEDECAGTCVMVGQQEGVSVCCVFTHSTVSSLSAR